MNHANLPKKSHLVFWGLLGGLILLITVRYAFQVDIPRALFLLVIGLIVLLGDQNEIVAMILCCIPLHESIDFYYALVLCTAVYVFKYSRHIRLGTNVLLVLLCIVWELLHCMRSSFSIMSFISSIIPFVVLAVFVASDVEKLDYPFIIRALSLTALGVTLVLFVRVLYFAGYNIALAIAGLQRLGSDLHSSIENVTVQGGQINPNTLGIVSVLAATGLMQLRNMGIGRKSDILIMCVLLVFASLSTSRTYLACLALMIVLLIFSERGGAAKKLKLIGLLFLAISLVVAVLAVYFTETFTYFISRFLERDITTGRGDLMILYHNFIVRNPDVMLFGIGLQDFGDRLIQVYRVAVGVPHNAIQELIIAWGIPGLFLFAGLFLSMYLESHRKNRRQSLINWIPLFILLFKGMAGQMLNSSYTMLAFSYAYLSLCTSNPANGPDTED